MFPGAKAGVVIVISCFLAIVFSLSASEKKLPWNLSVSWVSNSHIIIHLRYCSSLFTTYFKFNLVM